MATTRSGGGWRSAVSSWPALDMAAKALRLATCCSGSDAWEIVQFTFDFYGHATYNALVNPSDPMAQAVLELMVRTGDYFSSRLTPTAAARWRSSPALRRTAWRA